MGISCRPRPCLGDELHGLGSRDKQLAGYAGTHSETKPTAIAGWRRFISRHLAARD
jgi:hypothetical protein